MLGTSTPPGRHQQSGSFPVGDFGGMDDPQSRMQGKIIVESSSGDLH